MEERFCQSCGMPMGQTDERYGTEADGSKNKDYCMYCYVNGVAEHYCQSCGMPMGQIDELYGTEADGTKSKDYCSYCYTNGAFPAECTMQEMIDLCVQPMLENVPGMTEENARAMMQEQFPHLKRWQA